MTKHAPMPLNVCFGGGGAATHYFCIHHGRCLVHDWHEGCEEGRKVTAEIRGTHQPQQTRFDLLDAKAMRRIARVMADGEATHEPDEWRRKTVEHHLNHALEHIFIYLAQRQSGNVPYGEDNLGHAATRLMLACGVDVTAAERTAQMEVTR